MSEYFHSIYFYLSFGVFLPLLALIINFKSVKKIRALHIFSVYIFADVLCWFIQLFTLILDVRNIIIANIFQVFEFLLVSIFFLEIFNLQKKLKYYIIIFLVTIVYGIGIFTNGNNLFNNYIQLPVSLAFVIISLIYYSKIMRDEKSKSLFINPFFWFITGITFYFSTSIFITIFNNYTLEMTLQTQKTFWLIHSFINLISYVIFVVGFFRCKQKTKY